MGINKVVFKVEDDGSYEVNADDEVHSDLTYSEAYDMLFTIFGNVVFPERIDSLIFNFSKGTFEINGEKFNPNTGEKLSTEEEPETHIPEDAFTLAVYLAIQRLVREGKIKGVETE